MIRRLHCTLVRGFRRGNNANNTNLSPLYVNANYAPSYAITYIAFGKWYAIEQYKSPTCIDLCMRGRCRASLT